MRAAPMQARWLSAGAAICGWIAASGCISACAQATGAASAPAVNAQVLRGQAVYEAQCSACHSPDAHRVGPAHAGVVGRRAGTAPGYTYSEALRRSTVIWTAENLKAWLADPERVIPGQAMGYQLDSAAAREDVVAYLATLRATPARP